MTSGNSNTLPSTVLFDFDGTLVNTTPLILRSFRATWEKTFGFSFEEDAYIETFGMHLRASLKSLVNRGVETGRHAPPTDQEAALDNLISVYREFNLAWHDEMIAPFPEIDPLLQLLKDGEMRLGIVSSKLRVGVERGLRIFNLDKYFETIVGAEDVSRHKPDPEPIVLAIKRLGVRRENTIFVGDSTHDMMAGRAAKVRTVAATWGPFPRRDLEMTKPNFIVNSPLEIGTVLGTTRQ